MRRTLRSLACTLALTACGGTPSTPTEDAGVPDAGTVERRDAGPPAAPAFGALTGSSEGIALGRAPDGSSALYVAIRTGRIARVAPDGATTDVASIDSPVGLAVRADGQLLVCASGSAGPGIFGVSLDGTVTPLVTATPGGAPFGLTNFVLEAPDGSIVFSDSEANVLYRADADGANVAVVTDAITFPNGLAFSPDGATLHVASWSTADLYALSFDATTGAYGMPRVEFSGVMNVDGVVAASEGRLVLVSSTAGVLSLDLAAGATTPILRARDLSLPANGVFGDAAFGVSNLYLTSLTQGGVSVVATSLTAP